MRPSYWSASYNKRIRRRSLIAGAGSLALASAGLALLGCGGDDKDPEQISGLISKPTDTTAQARRGGTLFRSRDREFLSFDFDGPLADRPTTAFAYSSLTRLKAFKYPERALSVPEGDAASSWEVSPDGLRYTFKLRRDMKFDPRPPTNGRLLSSADFMYSAQKYAALDPRSGRWLHSVDPTAPILNFQAPDASTIVMNLAFPYAPSLVMTALSDFIVTYPVESENQFNAKNEMRGTGAWRLQKALTGDRLEFVKNPDWYDADKIFLDGFNDVIIPEYATRMAQFRAGSLATFSMGAKDILPTKQDLPHLILLADDSFTHDSQYMRISQRQDSPFNDVRVRQAASMLIDRNLMVEIIFNVPEFEAAGLPAEIRWDTAILCDEEFWMDPKSSEFGPNAKYLNYNPAEAKRLLQAAGFKNSIEVPLLMSNGHPSENNARAEIIAGMLEAHGDFKVDQRILNHSTEYRQQVNLGLNQFQGLGWATSATSSPDVDVWLSTYLRSTSPSRYWRAGDPKWRICWTSKDGKAIVINEPRSCRTSSATLLVRCTLFGRGVQVLRLS